MKAVGEATGEAAGLDGVQRIHRTKTVACTVLALFSFAANSLLCRGALGGANIDAASFTSLRLCSGAALLWFVAERPGKAALASKGSWTSALLLSLYALPFSFAYIRLSTGTGALILFGSVQATMLIAALWSGERLRSRQWIGLFLALAGLVTLVLPGLAAPSLEGAFLMSLAGIAWGLYSLRGRGQRDPLAHTAGNFLRSVPLVLAVSVVSVRSSHLELEGVLLAVASGALASGLGYVAWYAALRALKATSAAIVQLPVPVLTALAGVLILGETISGRLVLSTAMVLGGVALALRSKR